MYFFSPRGVVTRRRDCTKHEARLLSYSCTIVPKYLEVPLYPRAAARGVPQRALGGHVIPGARRGDGGAVRSPAGPQPDGLGVALAGARAAKSHSPLVQLY